MNHSSFNKMIILKPEIYEKLKQNTNPEINQLDRNIRKIMLNKSLTDIQKWYLLRQNLLKKRNKTSFIPQHKDEKMIRHIESKGTQTRVKPYFKDSSTQSEVNGLKSIGIQFPEEEIYEEGVDYVSDNEIDDNVLSKAMSATSVGERLRKRKSTRKQNVQIFETETGDIITVPLDSPSPPKKKEKSINSDALDSPPKRLLRSGKTGDPQTQINFPVRKSKFASSWTTYK